MATFGELLGALIVEKRTKAQMTQLDLALEAFEDETKVRRIVELENGQVKRPQVKTFGPICETLNISNREISECRSAASDSAVQNDQDIDELRTEIGSLSDALDQVKRLSRDQLEILAIRFEMDHTFDRSDGELRGFLENKAEEYRAYRAQIDGLDDKIPAIHNLKGAAEDAAKRLAFEEVEDLLSRVDELATEHAVEFKEARAQNALLRGRVEQAYDILSAAADSFGGIEPLEPARRRVRYGESLYRHALRYGGPGLSLLERMIRAALTTLDDDTAPDLWAEAKNALALALRNQGTRTAGPEGAALLAEAVETYRATLRVRTEADHPLDWAMTMQNLAIALKNQGTRTAGPDGAALLAEAVKTYRAALRVLTEADHPVNWAMTMQNFAIALEEQGIRTAGPHGAALLAKAVETYRAALRVRTEADHPVDWAMTMQNLAGVLQHQGTRIVGPEGAALLAEAVETYRAALRVRTEADHPVQWTMTMQNLAGAVLQQGIRTAGPNGAALLAEADAAYAAARKVNTKRDVPVEWAKNMGNMAILEQSRADHDTCTDPRLHLEAGLKYAEAALTIFDPEHMPYNFDKTTELRDDLLARLAALDGEA